MNFIVAGTTDIGIVKKTNQDSYKTKVYSTKNGKIVFAILCDGMGGLSDGEIASASVINAFSKWADTRLPILSQSNIEQSVIENEWAEISQTYNEKIKDYASQRGTTMGTTATIIMLTQSQYYILNIGDTRAYEITNTVSVLTKDQTVVAREIELGYLTEQQALTDPRRSVLLQCIGASEVVIPEFFFGQVKQNAVYMLCSDGFRHVISESEIFQFLNPNVMLEAQGMTNNMNALIELNKQRQERDNITVTAVRTF